MKDSSFLLKSAMWLFGRRPATEGGFILAGLFNHGQDAVLAAKSNKDDVEMKCSRPVDPAHTEGIDTNFWRAVHNSNAFATYLENHDPAYDVGLNIYGNFANDDEREKYAVALADLINRAIFASRPQSDDRNNPATG